MAITFPTTQSLIAGALNPNVKPFRPVNQTGEIVRPAPADLQPQQARLQAAFRNALLDPTKPIEPQFSTGSAKTDADLLRRAQIADAMDRARAAVVERRALQEMQGGPTSGVQQVGGTRVAFRNGVPVGIAQDTGVAPQRVQGQVGPSVLSPEQAQANRMRIAELAQQATARDAAARALMGARPATAAIAPAASAALPVTVARPAVEPVAPSPVVVQPTFTEALPDDTPRAASMRARQTGLLAPTMAQVPQATVQEAEDISEGATILAVEEQNQRTKADLDNRVTAATNKLVAASRTGRLAEIRAARQELNRVQSERQKFLASITPTSFEGGSTPFVGAAAPMF